MGNKKEIKIEKINANSIIRINNKNFNSIKSSSQGNASAFSEEELNKFLKIQQNSWKSLFWFILFPISIYFNFYSAYLIISTKWSSKRTNRIKYLWSLLTIFPLGCMGSLAFSFKGLREMMFPEQVK